MKAAIASLLLGCLAYNVSEALGGKASSLPKEFTLCKPGDDACLMGAISNALKLVKNGIPKINALPLDPLQVPEVLIDQSSGGAIRAKLSLKKLNILGLSDMMLYKAKGDFDDKTYRLELHGKAPSVMLQGDYQVSGQILVLPIRGSGKENITFVDLDMASIMTGHVVKKDGVDYVHVDDFKVGLKMSRAFVDFENLFDGDKRLGDGMNVVLNENWRLFLDELQPAIEEALGNILKEFAFRIYDYVPYRKIHDVTA